ncbi:CPBP family intramembrane glutamic endopeptidase [Nonomuraea sp. NPDC049480]|uniref:CPBP family intramembrane glutamic endopeptidase n=1 Tax=Nonomuraea sp. NPDC049480 TaxID=3364353 RepID=UPI0037BCF3AA
MTLRRTPGVFIALVFALAVPFWLVGAFSGSIPGMPMELPVSALMVVCPIVAAVILLRRQDGRGATRRLLLKSLAPGGMRRTPWLVTAFLLVPAIGLVAFGLASIGGIPAGTHASLLATPALFATFFVAAACEEAGWMGYAAEGLRQRWGASGTGVVLGVAWGAWHLVPLVQAGRSPWWIGWWFLSTVAARLVIVWLYDRTGRSVLSAVIFHAMLNVTQSVLPGYTSNTLLVACTALVTTAVGVALLALAPRCSAPSPTP